MNLADEAHAREDGLRLWAPETFHLDAAFVCPHPAPDRRLAEGGLSDLDTASPAYYALFVAFIAYMPVISVGSVLVYLVLIVQYINTGRIASGIQLRQLWDVAASGWGRFLLAGLYSYLAGIIAGMGAYIFCVGAVVTWPYAFLAQGHIAGQLARQIPRLEER